MEDTLPKHIFIQILTVMFLVVLLCPACSSNLVKEPNSIIATKTATEGLVTTTNSTISLTRLATSSLTASPEPSETPMPSDTSLPMPTLQSTITPIPAFTPEPVTTEPFEKFAEAVRLSYYAPFGIHESVAFRIEDDQLISYHFADIENPETIWQSEDLGDKVEGMMVAGSQAFILADNEMLIWNVSNPQQPETVAQIPVTGHIFLDEDGEQIYQVSILQGQAEVITVDISDPLQPVELGNVTLPWTSPLYFPSEIAENRIVLVNDGYIEIFDISDPNVAVFTAMISLPTNLNTSIEIKGDLLFIGATLMKIFSLTDFDEIIQLAQFDDFQFTDMSISENTAYLLQQICGWEVNDNDEVTGGCGYSIIIVDVSHPTSPEYKGRLRFETDTNQTWFDSSQIHGHQLFLETDHRFFVLDLTEVLD